MAEHSGSELRGVRELRKHMAWYFKGYPVGGEARAQMTRVSSLAELDAALAELDLDLPYPGVGAEGQRGRGGSAKTPSLPHGWLDDRDISAALAESLHEAELSISGG